MEPIESTARALAWAAMITVVLVSCIAYALLLDRPSPSPRRIRPD